MARVSTAVRSPRRELVLPLPRLLLLLLPSSYCGSSSPVVPGVGPVCVHVQQPDEELCKNLKNRMNTRSHAWRYAILRIPLSPFIENCPTIHTQLTEWTDDDWDQDLATQSLPAKDEVIRGALRTSPLFPVLRRSETRYGRSATPDQLRRTDDFERFDRTM